MKRSICIVALLLSAVAVSAQTRIYQHGTVTRMRIGRCSSGSSLLANLAGIPVQEPAENCPEYTLVSDRVVYVVVGKHSNHLIPLAEDIRFRLRKNELLVLIDDENRETSLSVREMTLRSEWENDEAQREQVHRAHQTRNGFIP